MHRGQGPIYLLALLVLGWGGSAADAATRKPNIVLIVADDMGWRDTGYSGNKIVKTPNLDDMAARALRFNYFYAGGQMCSPGRYALLTGRSPFRGGIHHLQNIRPQEITLARALRTAGYRCGQFGKWHLGSGPRSPIGMGFHRARWTPNYFDLDARFRIDDTNEFVPSKGDSSVAVTDLALEFMQEQAKARQPFFVYLCFGSPHSPHQAAPEFKALYAGQPKADFWGEISGLDAAVGKVRAELRRLGIADDTLVWFTSDNGGITPQSVEPHGKGKMSVGVRVPALLEWPAHVKVPAQSDVPCGHMDVYPTLLDLTGVTMPGQPILDGVSLVPLLDGKMKERARPLGFMLWNGKQEQAFAKTDFVKDTRAVFIDGKYKLVITPPGFQGKKAKGDSVALYDIYADQAEKQNLAARLPEVVERMRPALEEWQRSVRASYDGKDFAGK